MADESVHDLTAGYALDALDDHEARAFEEHLAQCVRCREELAELSETVAGLAFAAPSAAPPPALRERILDAARAERPNVVPLRPRWIVPAAAGGAVAVAAALALAVWSATLLGHVHANQRALGDARAVAAVLADPAARRVPLAGADGSLVVDRDRRAALVVGGLRAAPAGHTYEAWVVRGRRAQPVGLFRGGRDTTLLRLRRRVPVGAIVAATVEPAGGSSAPTGPFVFQTHA